MSVYYNLFSPLTNTLKESFENRTSPSLGLVAALVLIVVLVIQVFVVQFLWNNVLVSALSVAKPLKSLLHTLGLIVLLVILFP